MYGPSIICRTLSVASVADKSGTRWQYYSHSDHHTKVACWAILFDMLLQSPLLRRYAERGEVCFALNRELRDFWTGQKKTVDCVIGEPELDAEEYASDTTLRTLRAKLGIRLDPREEELLEYLPEVFSRPVRSIHLAVQARACMTGHSTASVRLQRDLCANHAAIHGAADAAIAVGLVLVNAAEEFVSPDRNRRRPMGSTPVVSHHTQPRDAIRVRDCICEVPFRDRRDDAGYDALGLVALAARNDGSPVELVDGDRAAAPGPDDPLHYDGMVQRITNAYEGRFAAI